MFAQLLKQTWRKYKAIFMKELRNKPETIPSAEKPQVPNKMELIEN